MVNFIKKANKEFETNGRSDKFVAMENKIIALGKPIQSYFFARYVRGADIARLQKVVLDSNDLELIYFYQMYIKGADIKLSLAKTVEQDDAFWVEKFLEILAHDYCKANPTKQKERLGRTLNTKLNFEMSKVIEFAGVGEILKDFPRRPFPSKMNYSNFDINSIIIKAKAEMEQNGRSDSIKDLEKLALYARGSAAGRLYIENIPDVNIRDFERVAILRGDSFNMFWLATQAKGVNRLRMLKGLELAREDKDILEEEQAIKLSRKKEIQKSLERTTDRAEYYRLIASYRDLERSTSDYVSQIDNDYVTRINYLIAQEMQVKNRG